MKIAIPTNDRKTIAKRTGRAEEFAIYQIENNQIQGAEYLKNTHSHDDDNKTEENPHGNKNTHHHEHGEHNHDELLLLLKDIDILLVRAVGKHMKQTLQKGNIPYQLVKTDTISKLLKNYFKV